MEGLGSEVSQKIRAAIKAKLIELGAYVDDELPDYIMVMVANKRTRSQMDEDLQLFLTSNTKIFTSWLHTVLQKLQEVTVANFEGNKDSNGRKSSKKKKSEIVEESVGKSKKHSKKHKEGKKAKKNKHKSKEKVKLRSEPKEKDEINENSTKGSNQLKASQEFEKNLEKKLPNIESTNKSVKLNEAVEKAILENLRKHKRDKGDKNDFSSDSSSHSQDSSHSKTKNAKEIEAGISKAENDFRRSETLKTNAERETEVAVMESSKSEKQLIEDEFNIEPLKSAEKCSEAELNDTCTKQTATKNLSDSLDAETTIAEKNVSVPTEELLKEHNKILKEKSDVEEKIDVKNSKSCSEESISPEEMRKQLLLSRAKKKLESSKLAERMRSNSPDVLILEETSRAISGFPNSSSKQDDFSPSKAATPPRSGIQSRYSPAKSPPGGRFSSASDHKKSPTRKNTWDRGSREIAAEKRWTKVKDSSSAAHDRETDRKRFSEDGEKRKNVIKISESLEMEKNLGVKRERETTREKEISTKKKCISSRVVTITGPEAPEIPSIVKVKPREYMAKDKQANKALILKAVADAEKSIATIHTRVEPEPEMKKNAIFTKNLREKRYEKLAVTLSNIRKSPDSRGRSNRRNSAASEKSDRSGNKMDSSEVSEGLRGKSDLTSRKMSRSEDQFISSKTTIMEKNEKYIRCWLEGVEKAVRDDEMVNPSEVEDFVVRPTLTEEECETDSKAKKENDKKRSREIEDGGEGDKVATMKNPKLDEKAEMSNLKISDDGPQIVVTLDGLDSKTIKDIILRNKKTVNGPILSLRKNEGSRTRPEKFAGGEIDREKSPVGKKSGPEKISDRFGRLNKANDDFESGKCGRIEVKGSKSREEKRETVSTESKNRMLIAQLSEKFGKVDREFEDKKKRYREEVRGRHPYDWRRSDKRQVGEWNGQKYKKSERRSNREGTLKTR